MLLRYFTQYASKFGKCSHGTGLGNVCFYPNIKERQCSAERSYSTFKLGGAAVRKYPSPKVRSAAVLCCSSRKEILQVQGKINPSKMVGVCERASEGRHSETIITETSQSDHRTTVLSNSVKLSHAMWGHPRWMGHGGEV